MMLSINCPICGVAATQTCTRCRMVRYCNGEHQKQHWPEHKKSCKPYRVAEDAQLGRYLVATQNIKQKQIIFVEDPIVVGPKWFLSEPEKTATIVPCVACYTPCRLGKYVCGTCRWPVCSVTCHHENLECAVLSLGPGPAARTDTMGLHDYYRGDALMVIKCLLLQLQHPERWTALLEMQSHEQERNGTELYQEIDKRVVSFLQHKFLHKLHLISKQFNKRIIAYDPELMHRVCGIIETNYMAIQLATGVELSGLFRTACMMEHNCRPNVYFQFDGITQQIAVRAGCDIKKGEHLSISYTNILWGTQMRQHHLRITKHFSCHCERCLDPTEFGSFVSALNCLGDANQSCTGIQLPVDPLDEQAQWKCDTCPMALDANFATELQSRMTDDAEQLLEGRPKAKDIELMLARMSHMLHSNHFHMFNLKHSLIQLYGYEEGLQLPNLTEDQLARKMRLCEELCNVCHCLDPYSIKLSIYYTIILMEITYALEEQARRMTAKNEHGEVTKLYEQARQRLTEATDVLEKELDSVAGNKLNEKLQKDIFELDKLILAHSHRLGQTEI